MNEYVKWLNTEIGMPDEAAKICEEYFDKILGDAEFPALRDKFFAGDDITAEKTAMAERLGLHIHTYDMVLSEVLTLRMKEIYAERGYPDEIFRDSVRDLAIWTKVCMRDDKIVGNSHFGWCSHQLRCNMFRIGRMQFHLIKYAGEEYSVGNYSVKPGDTVVNMHIPEGDSLTWEKRIDSYRRAYKFFEGKYNTFTCSSYLFYKGHYDILPKNSNILAFMGDFHLYNFTEELDEHNLWRIFDKRESYDPKTLPRDTGLRRAYAEHIEKNGPLFGGASGVFFFDGENIVKE